MQRNKLSEGIAVDVTAADRIGNFALRLQFSNGFEREIDFERFLRASSHPQIREFLEPKKFAQFRLQDGELRWGDYDLCFSVADLYEGTI